MRHTFTARYKDECVDCPEPIRRGDRVQYTEALELRHEECPEDTSLRAHRPMCPECHLELPMSGECCEET